MTISFESVPVPDIYRPMQGIGQGMARNSITILVACVA
jgi:hypothetical protein